MTTRARFSRVKSDLVWLAVGFVLRAVAVSARASLRVAPAEAPTPSVATASPGVANSAARTP